MHKRLSRRPSVEFYHKQANRFLKAHRKGDAEIRNRLFASLPELGNVTEKGKLATRLSLKDMLRMIALEARFQNVGGYEEGDCQQTYHCAPCILKYCWWTLRAENNGNNEACGEGQHALG